MSATKLTLSIPKTLLLEAKVYSRKAGQPLSRLVSRYFALLARSVHPPGKTGEITPRVKQLTGLARSGKSEEELLFEALSDKHLKRK